MDGHMVLLMVKNRVHNDASADQTTYGDSFTTGDAIGVAFDADNGILTFYKNGVSQGACILWN